MNNGWIFGFITAHLFKGRMAREKSAILPQDLTMNKSGLVFIHFFLPGCMMWLGRDAIGDYKEFIGLYTIFFLQFFLASLLMYFFGVKKGFVDWWFYNLAGAFYTIFTNLFIMVFLILFGRWIFSFTNSFTDIFSLVMLSGILGLVIFGSAFWVFGISTGVRIKIFSFFLFCLLMAAVEFL